jgi:hypothetical protein
MIVTLLSVTKRSSRASFNPRLMLHHAMVASACKARVVLAACRAAIVMLATPRAAVEQLAMPAPIVVQMIVSQAAARIPHAAAVRTMVNATRMVQQTINIVESAINASIVFSWAVSVSKESAPRLFAQVVC